MDEYSQALCRLGAVLEPWFGRDDALEPLDRASWLSAGPNAGFLELLPLVRAQVPGTVWGVRAVSGRALAKCPVVLADTRTRETLTLADGLAMLVPNWMLVRSRGMWSSDWERLAGDAQAWSELADIHAALGGEPSLLDRTRAAISGRELRDAGHREAAPAAKRQWPYLAASALGDTPFGSLLQLFGQVGEFKPRKPDSIALKSFRRAGQMVSLYNRELGPIQAVDAEQLRRTCVDVVRGAVGSEAGYIGPIVGARPIGAEIKGTGPAWSAARVLLEKDPEHALDDPSVHASRVMLAVGPKEYDGRAHLDAAETLRAQGQGEQAIASLLSAAFFQAARYGVPPEMVEAAAALYRELGAESHEQALMAGLRQQLPM